MATILKSIYIDAPVEKVFQYLDSPANLVEIWPSLMEVRDIMVAPDGKSTYDWSYKMFGVRLDGTSEEISHIPDRHLSWKSRGGVDSIITWAFAEENHGTRVTLHGVYQVPIPVLGRLAEIFVVKQNEREVETILENLKARMEVGERVK